MFTYKTMKDTFKLAINIEDEYSNSCDETGHDFQERKGGKFSSIHDPPPIPSSSSMIKEAYVRVITEEVTKKFHEEVL